MLTIDGEEGRTELPVAVVADRDDDGRILEQRVYYGTWPPTGRHTSFFPSAEQEP